MTDRSPRRPFGLGALLLIAFALQTAALNRQSLWYDEGFSVYLSGQSLANITTRTAADIHPPLYYYLLHFWQASTGTGEFSLRLVSVFFALLCVALSYALGTRLFDRRVGHVTAVITVVSPLYLWYGRDARMYTMVTAFGIASSYLLLRLLAGDAHRLAWFGYVVAAVAATYAHFYALFLLAFQVLYTIVYAFRRPASRQHVLARVGAAQALALVAFLPWSGFAWTRLGADVSYWPGTLPLTRVLRDTLIAYATGHTVTADLAAGIAAGYLLLFAGSFLLIGRRWPKARDGAGIFLALYLLVPPALLFLISYGRPKWHPRYLMLASPPFLLALAAGVVALWSPPTRHSLPSRRALGRGAAILAVSFLLATAAFADVNLFRDARFTKDDWRSLATYITRHKQPNEVVLLVSGHTFPVFTYYYPAADWVPLPDAPTLSTRHVLGFDVADDLNRALAGKRGAWLVLWEEDVADPNGLVPLMLSAEGRELPVPPAFWGLGLRHFRLAPDAHFSAAPPVQREVHANFGDALHLLGYRLPDNPSPADRGAELTLFWQAPHPLTEDLRLALRVRDEAGILWGQLDRRPADYVYPTDRWVAGQTVPGHYQIPLLPGTPPGEYWLDVGVYAEGRPEGLDVLDAAGAAQGKTVRIGPIPIARPDRPPEPVALQLANPLDVPLAGGLILLGSTLPGSPVIPGDQVVVTLGWQATQPLTAGYQLRLSWENASSADGERLFSLGTTGSPADTWQAGDVIRIQRQLPVPRGAAAGPLALRVTLLDPNGEPVSDRVEVGRVAVQEISRQFTSPVPANRTAITFGEEVRLIGYASEATAAGPGQSAQVTLYWQSLAPMDRSYTRFVHLIDAAGKVWAQLDGVPLGNLRPTTSWLPGEYLTDTITLPIGIDVPSGNYRLEIGLYDRSDPRLPRLLVYDAQGMPVGDSVVFERFGFSW